MVFNKRTGTKGKHRPHELIYFVYLFAYFTYNFQNVNPLISVQTSCHFSCLLGTVLQLGNGKGGQREGQR